MDRRLDSGLVTQFTEDVPSTKATVCEREKCKAPIAAGEPRHYIGGYNSQNGKHVCTKCIDYYRAQPATMSRKEFERGEVQDVRRSVNDARRKGANPSVRRVTAVSGLVDTPGPSNGLMLPPPVPGLQPRVEIPSSWNVYQPGYIYPPIPPAGQNPSQLQYSNTPAPNGMYGYSGSHAQYGVTRRDWAARAYQSSLADTITLRFKVLREISGKPNGVQVHNLSEGKPNVLATSTPAALRTMAIDTMDSKTRLALKNYPIKWESVVLREISNWVDLAQENQHMPYFYERCLTGKPKGKDGINTFKKPTKAFELALVINPDLWEEITEFVAQTELNTEMSLHSSRHGKKATATRIRRIRSASPSGSDSPPASPGPSEYSLRTASFHSSQNTGYLNQSMSDNSVSKRRRSDSESLPRTPPQSKRRAVPVYESPNREKLCEALLSGGSSYSQVLEQAHIVSEQVEFFQIPYPPLGELLSGKFQGFTCDPAEAAHGSLGVEDGKYLGIGTFKTAQPGFLSLVHLATEGLGQKLNEAVAIKRMYVPRAKPTGANPAGWMITRLMPADEFRKTLMEANVLLWAGSLMALTYAFIENYIENSPHIPPFEIPQVRFIHAGVAAVHQAASGPPSNNKSSICRSYLIEEYIDEEKDGFYKFINNASAVPIKLPTADSSLSLLATFLSFTQHVQYYKTKGTVYLSDLQGSSKLLTDPQIMTAPSIGDGVEIFGEGNVPAAFEAFPKQHICNQFCRWFKLPPFEETE
ncbi:hypothetical protein B0H11DRAFT_2092188 [Mycena galericulata]|nr:hypothetical protein B0H11DRAFT_2092188 [Mycena galericulata]